MAITGDLELIIQFLSWPPVQVHFGGSCVLWCWLDASTIRGPFHFSHAISHDDVFSVSVLVLTLKSDPTKSKQVQKCLNSKIPSQKWCQKHVKQSYECSHCKHRSIMNQTNHVLILLESKNCIKNLSNQVTKFTFDKVGEY